MDAEHGEWSVLRSPECDRVQVIGSQHHVLPSTLRARAAELGAVVADDPCPSLASCAVARPALARRRGRGERLALMRRIAAVLALAHAADRSGLPGHAVLSIDAATSRPSGNTQGVNRREAEHETPTTRMGRHGRAASDTEIRHEADANLTDADASRARAAVAGHGPAPRGGGGSRQGVAPPAAMPGTDDAMGRDRGRPLLRWGTSITSVVVIVVGVAEVGVAGQMPVLIGGVVPGDVLRFTACGRQPPRMVPLGESCITHRPVSSRPLPNTCGACKNPRCLVRQTRGALSCH